MDQESKEKFVVGADVWLIRKNVRGKLEEPVEGKISKVGRDYAEGLFNCGVHARIDMRSQGDVLASVAGTGKIVFLARPVKDQTGTTASVVFNEDFPAFKEAAKRQILWGLLRRLGNLMEPSKELTTDNLVVACRALGIVGEDDVKG